MNNEETRLINEPTNETAHNPNENIKGQTSEQEPIIQQQPQNVFGKKSKKNNSKITAAAAGGFVAGVASGFAGTAMASNTHNESVPDETAEDVETPSPEDIILANDEGVRYAHVDADNFADAFAQAREQVGPGGVFEYEGRLYGTYTADEWNAMSAEEKIEYQNNVSEIVPAHQSSASNNITGHSTTNASDSEVIEVNSDMIDQTPVDNEIKILGVEAVQDSEGNIMNVALVENNGEQALLLDVDNNGVIDVLVYDEGHDGVIDDTDIHDISDANIHVADLIENTDSYGMSESDSYYTSYNGDDDIPDYFNDADSSMMV